MKHIKEVYPKLTSPCYCMNLRRTSRAVTQFYDEAIKPSGLTIAQLALLRNLEFLEKTTIGDLAKRLRIDRTTLNRNMKPLADSGLIVINPGKDSRTREITLTKEGKDASFGVEAMGWAQEDIEGIHRRRGFSPAYTTTIEVRSTCTLR